MAEVIKHIQDLLDCVKDGRDYYIIFRDKQGKIRIDYSHDWEGKFKKEVFKILLKKATADNSDFKTASPKLKHS